jgi:integration host factor subunit beta
MSPYINSFNKSDLILQMERKFSDLNQETVVEAVDILLQEIINNAALDQRIEIRGFGVFSKKSIRPRKFVNPKTKEVSYLGETSTMHFKASGQLLTSHD